MCSMLPLHAAWSAALCSGPSGTSRKPGPTSSRGTAKSGGTNGRSVTSVSVRGRGRRWLATIRRIGDAHCHIQAWLTAILFTIANALVLNVRIRAEDKALGYV